MRTRRLRAWERKRERRRRENTTTNKDAERRKKKKATHRDRTAAIVFITYFSTGTLSFLAIYPLSGPFRFASNRQRCTASSPYCLTRILVIVNGLTRHFSFSAPKTSPVLLSRSRVVVCCCCTSLSSRHSIDGPPRSWSCRSTFPPSATSLAPPRALCPIH